MKKIIFLISFVFVSFISEAQTKKPVDTTQICIPYDVAQKMLLDLNEYDKLKELSKLDKKERAAIVCIDVCTDKGSNVIKILINSDN